MLVEHAASAALARDAQEALAAGAGRVDFVIDERAGRVSDPEAGSPDPRRHLGLFLMARRTRTKAFIERTDPVERGAAKRHVRPQHAPYFDYLFAVIRDRQIEIAGAVAGYR
jgi:hypothetical protein